MTTHPLLHPLHGGNSLAPCCILPLTLLRMLVLQVGAHIWLLGGKHHHQHCEGAINDLYSLVLYVTFTDWCYM